MAKKNPHKRKKQLKTDKQPKTVSVAPIESNDEPAEVSVNEVQEERSWSVFIILALLIFVGLGVLFYYVNQNNDDEIPRAESSESTSSSSGDGVIINGGNLGQISNGSTSGIQSNSNPLGPASSSNSNPASSGQSGQLQPTIDKCTYQQYEQLPNDCKQ